jgi:endonuclease G, mitochondrial
MKAVYLLVVITISVTGFSAHASEIKRIDYEGFTVWVDCDKRGAVKFQYNAQHDTGSFKRHKSFHIDPDISSSCQQLSVKTYKKKGQRYDRGHLVPANHLDYSKVAIRQSNFMTNILPQAANMNRGAWLLTEEITECYRDIDELLIIGGVLWGNNEDDDFFKESHGVKTPDAFWKVIIRNDRAIAWIIPNSSDAKRDRLDDYIVTIQELELVTGESIPVDEYIKHEKPEHSWMIPRGCNKG